MNRHEIGEIIQQKDLSLSGEFEIHGPWGYRALNGFEAPTYIYQRGTGEKVRVGKVIAKTERGLQFELVLDEEYTDLENATFDVPMRFHAKRKDS